jgi:hypothetical protein
MPEAIEKTTSQFGGGPQLLVNKPHSQRQRVDSMRFSGSASHLSLEELYKKGGPGLRVFLENIQVFGSVFTRLANEQPSLFSLENRFLEPEAYELLLYALCLKVHAFSLGHDNALPESELIKQPADQLIALLIMSGVKINQEEAVFIAKNNPHLLSQAKRLSSKKIISSKTLVHSVLPGKKVPKVVSQQLQDCVDGLWQEKKEYADERDIKADVGLFSKEILALRKEVAAELKIRSNQKKDLVAKAITFLIQDRLLYYHLFKDQMGHIYFKTGTDRKKFWEEVKEGVLNIIKPFQNLPTPKGKSGGLVAYRPKSLAAAIVKKRLANQRVHKEVFKLHYSYIDELNNKSGLIEYTFQLVFWSQIFPDLQLDNIDKSEQLFSLSGKPPVPTFSAAYSLTQDLAPYRIEWAELVAKIDKKPKNKYATYTSPAPQKESVLFTTGELVTAKKKVKQMADAGEDVSQDIDVPWKYPHLKLVKTIRLPSWWLLEKPLPELIEVINKQVLLLLSRKRKNNKRISLEPDTMFHDCVEHFWSLSEPQ